MGGPWPTQVEVVVAGRVATTGRVVGCDLTSAASRSSSLTPSFEGWIAVSSALIWSAPMHSSDSGASASKQARSSLHLAQHRACGSVAVRAPPPRRVHHRVCWCARETERAQESKRESVRASDGGHEHSDDARANTAGQTHVVRERSVQGGSRISISCPRAVTVVAVVAVIDV